MHALQSIGRTIPEDIGKGHVIGRVPLGPAKGSDVLGRLTGKECELIGMHSDIREIRKKETIYSQGGLDNKIYMLEEGVVKLTRITPQGNKLITDVLGRRTAFGGMTWTEGQGRDESAVVLEDGRICVLSKDGLSRIEEAAPGLAARVKGLMEERRRRCQDRIVGFLFSTVTQRVANALISLIEDFGSVHNGGYLLNISLTHQAYADLVASSRETVTAVLTRLRKAGAIEYEGRHIVVRSVDKLNEVAR
jgi:CRP/FNR family cyclic AMP-dependent transcriptional regulator